MTVLDINSKICLYCKIQENKEVKLNPIKLKVDNIRLFEYEDRYLDEQTTIEIPLVCPKCLMISYFVKDFKYQD